MAKFPLSETIATFAANCRAEALTDRAAAVVKTGIARPASFISGLSGRIRGERNWWVRPILSRMSPITPSPAQT